MFHLSIIVNKTQTGVVNIRHNIGKDNYSYGRIVKERINQNSHFFS